MKIFVISLLDATERRVSAQTQLDEAGLPFRFFDAINGTAAWRHFAGYDSMEYRIHTGRSAAAGEVGCFASHTTLWHRCIELNEPILVMEDDFHAHPNFSAAVAELGRHIDDFGFVRLEETPPRNLVPVINCAEFSLNYCRKYPHGSTCYAISPRVAKEFVTRSKILIAPVDKFIKNFWEHQQPLYSLQPAPVMRNELSLDSSMVDRVPLPQSPVLRLRRMARKAVWIVRRARFNAHMMKATKTQTDPAMRGTEPASSVSGLSPARASWRFLHLWERL